jgi:hypothetical protein
MCGRETHSLMSLRKIRVVLFCVLVFAGTRVARMQENAPAASPGYAANVDLGVEAQQTWFFRDFSGKVAEA